MTSNQFAEWRKFMGLSQKQAAVLLGFKHRATISQFENGYSKITPRVANLCKLLMEANDVSKTK